MMRMCDARWILSINNNNQMMPSGEPVEIFWGFVPIFSHTAKNFANIVLEKLKFNIDISIVKDKATTMLKICLESIMVCKPK